MHEVEIAMAIVVGMIVLSFVLQLIGVLFGGNSHYESKSSPHHPNDIGVNPVRDEIRNSRNRDY